LQRVGGGGALGGVEGVTPNWKRVVGGSANSANCGWGSGIIGRKAHKLKWKPVWSKERRGNRKEKKTSLRKREQKRGILTSIKKRLY